MNIYDRRIIGGSARDTPMMLPQQLIDGGWNWFADEMLESANAFNAPGGLIIHNPCGVRGKPMWFNQRKEAAQHGLEKVADYHELFVGFSKLMIERNNVFVYLGTPENEMLDFVDLYYALAPFTDNGCDIIIDAAGVRPENSISWAIAVALKKMYIGVHYEPRPKEAFPWPHQKHMKCFVLEHQWDRTDPEKHNDAARKNAAANHQIQGEVVLMINRPSIKKVLTRLSQGYSIAVSGGWATQKGYTAQRFLDEAKTFSESGS